jgi:hypothetical protein
MKNLIVVIQVVIVSSATFAQGLVNFYNTPTTLVTFGPRDSASPIAGPPGSYYFGLLTSSSLAGPYTFTGVYATNQASPGLFTGGASVAVSGWTPGATLFYLIAGWSANMGHDFNPAWLMGTEFPPYPIVAWFGLSSFGMGAAGGTTSSGTLPPLDLFGGTSGIQSGFDLPLTLVPEPSATALLGVGIVVWGSRFRRLGRGVSLGRGNTSAELTPSHRRCQIETVPGVTPGSVPHNRV